MKKICFTVLILLFAVCANAETVDVMWHKVDDNNYVYKDGIVGTEDRYGFTFLLKSYNKGQYESVNGNKIQYTLTQYTLDCGKRSYKTGEIDSYGIRDNFVYVDYNKFAQFQPIVPGTAISELYKKLCRP